MSGHLFVTSSWSELGFCSRTMIQNTPANPPLNGWRKTKWRLWSGLVKVLTWILLRCCGMTLKRRFMLENPPMWLNYNNSAKMSGPKFLHSAVTDSLQVIANTWWQLLLLRVAQPVIRFRGQALFHTGPWRFGYCFPFIIKNFIQKLHVVLTCVIFDLYLNLFDDLKHWSVANMQKNKKSGRGPTLFHTTVNICVCVCIYTHILYMCVCVCILTANFLMLTFED